MNYKVFYLLARRLAKKRISRGVFVSEWREEQKRQGISPQSGRFVRTGGARA
jgi:hypothetical protein